MYSFIQNANGTLTILQNGIKIADAATPKQAALYGYTGSISPVSPAPTSSSASTVNAGRVAVTLGNGQVVYYDNQGHAFDASGNPISNSTISTSTATSTPTTGTASTTSPQNQAQLDALLANPNLTPDQKQVIRSIYSAVSTNDTATGAKITAAMQAASQYSDPYFKAQIQLATDALQRGLVAKDGDLAYQESSLSNALDALRKDTSAAKDNLSLEHASELKQLADKYQTDLEDTRTNLAASGFSDSSKRARAEEILSSNNDGLVETSNRNFSYQTGQLDRTLAAKESDTAAQIANLQRLTTEGKLDLTRQTEAKIGSSAMSNLGYSTLGGVTGTIPYNQAKDSLDFANNFVF